MPTNGLDQYEDRLQAYATLGFYFDGVDYSNKSARVISNLIKRMDSAAVDYQVTQLRDEDNDRFGFAVEGKEYWFTSPSIQKLPKTSKLIVPKYYKELINNLADDPQAVLDLDYALFGELSDCLGECLGIA